jgi:glycosyltransferase involved in cell wall biosynthesis
LADREGAVEDMGGIKILHIAAHMGAGAGKAIGGLAVADKFNTHSIYLLDTPQKWNHVEYCGHCGVKVYFDGDVTEYIRDADVVVISWWGHRLTDELFANFPQIPCRIAIWAHKNGFYDPPLPQFYVDKADALMVTTPYSLENPKWSEAALVHGFGCFDPARARYKSHYALSTGKFTIGFIGTPAYKKLPLDYLDYCREVVRKIPDCRFVIAGEASRKLLNDVEERGMGSYFEFMGWVEDVQSLLLTFDVFGYLLRSDTFATTENAVLEALAAGLPSVVSRNPVGRYLLNDGISGFLAETPKEYAQIIKSLYEDENLREKTGNAARKHVVQMAGADENLRRFDSVCEKVVKLPKKLRYFQ